MANRRGKLANVPARAWLLIAAQGIQSFSAAFLALALAFTGAAHSDPAGLGLSLAARTLPTLVFALGGGVLADRASRSRIAALCFTVIALSNAALAVTIPAFGLGWQTQAVCLISGVAQAFGAPALYAIMPSIVDPDDLISANAAQRTVRNAASVLGPALGGGIATTVGTPALAWGAAICTLAAALGVSTLRLPATEARRRAGLLTDIREAGTCLRDLPGIAAMLPVWAVLLALQAGAASTLLPLIVTHEAGKATWASVASGLAIGYIAGSLSQMVRPLRRSLLPASVVAFLATVIQLAFVWGTHTPALWILGAVIAGIGLELSGVWWGTYLQRSIPDAVLGKVSSLDYAVSFGSLPLGYALIGSAAAATSPRGILGVVVVALAVTGTIALGAGYVARRRLFAAPQPLREDPGEPQAAR